MPRPVSTTSTSASVTLEHHQALLRFLPRSRHPQPQGERILTAEGPPLNQPHPAILWRAVNLSKANFLIRLAPQVLQYLKGTHINP